MPRPKAIRSSWGRCSATWSRPGCSAAKPTAGWSPAAARRRCPKGCATWSGGVWDGCQRRPARCCRWRPCSAATSTSSCWPRCEMPRRAACLTPWTRRWGRDLSRRRARTATALPTYWSAPRCWRSFPRLAGGVSTGGWAKRPRSSRPDDVVALAYHFSQAGPDGEGTSRAVRYGLAAAEQALQARALGDAEARFHQVLGLLDDPATDAAPARIAALCGLGEAQRDQGNAEFRTTLLEAGRLAQASADAPTLVRAALANSRGLPSMIGAVDTDRVAITEAALEAVGPRPTADGHACSPTWPPSSASPATTGGAWHSRRSRGHRARPRRQRPARVGAQPHRLCRLRPRPRRAPRRSG